MKWYAESMKHKGFTVVELIIVIVLIGILSVVAGPKLISITAKASAATIDGATGALKSAMNIAYGTAASENKQSNSTATVTVDGASVDVVYGYPKGSAASLKAFTDLDDFTVDETSVGDGKTVSIAFTYGTNWIKSLLKFILVSKDKTVLYSF